MADLPTLALTLIQPWGTLVMHHGKTVENRTWAPSASQLRRGDRFWIHAGKKVDGDVCLEFDGCYGFDRSTPVVAGALLGHVRLVSVARPGEFVKSPWYVGPFGWCISDPIALPTPIPCRGAQGLWRVPDDVLACAKEVLGG